MAYMLRGFAALYCHHHPSRLHNPHRMGRAMMSCRTRAVRGFHGMYFHPKTPKTILDVLLLGKLRIE